MKSERAIKPIRSERDHQRALAEIAELMEKNLDAAGEDRLDVLTTLADAYEKEHHALGLPSDPIDAIKAHMDQSGRSQADLAALLTSRSRASEILHRRSALSLSMIRKLRDAWGIPTDILVGGAALAGERLARYRVSRRRSRRNGRKK